MLPLPETWEDQMKETFPASALAAITILTTSTVLAGWTGKTPTGTNDKVWGRIQVSAAARIWLNRKTISTRSLQEAGAALWYPMICLWDHWGVWWGSKLPGEHRPPAGSDRYQETDQIISSRCSAPQVRLQEVPIPLVSDTKRRAIWNKVVIIDRAQAKCRDYVWNRWLWLSNIIGSYEKPDKYKKNSEYCSTLQTMSSVEAGKRLCDSL